MHGGRVMAAEWSADGSTLATLGRDGGCGLVGHDRPASGRRRTHRCPRCPDDDPLGDSQAIVVGQVNGRMLFVDPADGAIVPAKDGRTERTPSTAPEPGGRGTCWSLPTTLAVRRSGISPAVGGSTPSTCPGVGAVRPCDEVSRTAGWRRPSATPTGRSSSTPTRARSFDSSTAAAARARARAAVQGWTPDGRSLLISRQLSTTTSDLLVVDATTGEVELQVRWGRFAREATADPTGRYFAVATTSERC